MCIRDRHGAGHGRRRLEVRAALRRHRAAQGHPVHGAVARGDRCLLYTSRKPSRVGWPQSRTRYAAIRSTARCSIACSRTAPRSARWTTLSAKQHPGPNSKPLPRTSIAWPDVYKRQAEECPYNEVVRKGSAVGVVCAGAVYQHVVEARPDASVFKLGLTWPLPQQAPVSYTHLPNERARGELSGRRRARCAGEWKSR